MPRPKDPIGVYNFEVEIEGLVIGGFSEVSGLDSEIETEPIYEGGLNNSVHHLPKKVKDGRLLLRKGMCINGELVNWFQKCKNGDVKKHHITIKLLDAERTTVFTWSILNVFPVKCSWPKLAAQSSNEVAIETIELVYEELKFQKN